MTRADTPQGALASKFFPKREVNFFQILKFKFSYLLSKISIFDT